MPCNSVNVGVRNDEFVTGKAKFGCGGMTNDGNDQKWGGITKNGGNGWGWGSATEPQPAIDAHMAVSKIELV